MYFVSWQNYLASVGTRCRFPNNVRNVGIVGILTPSQWEGNKIYGCGGS